MSQEVDSAEASGEFEAELYFAMKWPETGEAALFNPEQVGETVPDVDPPVQYENQGSGIIIEAPSDDGTPIRYQLVLYHDGERELVILNTDPAEGESPIAYVITDDPDYAEIQTNLPDRTGNANAGFIAGDNTGTGFTTGVGITTGAGIGTGAATGTTSASIGRGATATLVKMTEGADINGFCGKMTTGLTGSGLTGIASTASGSGSGAASSGAGSSAISVSPSHP